MVTFSDVVKEAVRDLDQTGKDAERCFAMHRAASVLDDLRSQLVRDAKDMAVRFDRYAEQCTIGDVRGAPTGWSTLQDIARNEGRYAAQLEAFKDTFRLLTGKKYREVRDALEDREEASSAKVRAAAVSR